MNGQLQVFVPARGDLWPSMTKNMTRAPSREFHAVVRPATPGDSATARFFGASGAVGVAASFTTPQTFTTPQR